MLDIEALIKQAIKDKNSVALTAFRSVKAKTMLTLTAAKREHGKPLSQEEELAALKREIKERKESNEFLKETDSGYLENSEIIKLLETFLPKTLSTEEMDKLVSEAIKAAGANSAKEFGKVMGYIKKQGLAVDMGYISSKVKESLGG